MAVELSHSTVWVNTNNTRPNAEWRWEERKEIVEVKDLAPRVSSPSYPSLPPGYSLAAHIDFGIISFPKIHTQFGSHTAINLSIHPSIIQLLIITMILAQA